MIPPAIERYLKEHGIPYQVQTHQPRITAQEVAAQAHVSGKSFGKTVVLRRGGALVLALLPAHEHVNLEALEHELGEPVRLAEEQEFAGMFPECEVGAMPPLGGLYGMPVLAHSCLAKQGTITCNAGTHSDAISFDWERFAQAEHPRLIKG